MITDHLQSYYEGTLLFNVIYEQVCQEEHLHEGDNVIIQWKILHYKEPNNLCSLHLTV